MTATATSQELATPNAYVISTAPDGSPEWHRVRRGGIGGSDVSAVLGMTKYSSPLKLYLEKRGEAPDIPRSPELEEAAEFGHELQDVIANRWAKRTGLAWERARGTFAHAEQPWMRVNLDGIAVEGDGRGVLEIKNRSAYQLDEWTEGVPDGPALQAYWGMAVTGYRFAHVVALVGGNRLMRHRLEWDETVITDLVTLVARFWRDNVCVGVEPPVDNSEATKELISHLYGVKPAAVKTVNPAEVEPLRDQWRVLTAKKKQAVEEFDAEIRGVENRLRKIAGEAEVVTGGGNEPLYTLKANGTFASKRFTTAHPDLAEEYTTLAPVLDVRRLAADHPDIYTAHRARVLRISGGKK